MTDKQGETVTAEAHLCVGTFLSLHGLWQVKQPRILIFFSEVGDSGDVLSTSLIYTFTSQATKSNLIFSCFDPAAPPPTTCSYHRHPRSFPKTQRRASTSRSLHYPQSLSAKVNKGSHPVEGDFVRVLSANHL